MHLTIAVDRSWQGKGLGSDLAIDALSRARSVAGEVGLKLVVLDVIEDGGKEAFMRRMEFYRRLGFGSFSRLLKNSAESPPRETNESTDGRSRKKRIGNWPHTKQNCRDDRSESFLSSLLRIVRNGCSSPSTRYGPCSTTDSRDVFRAARNLSAATSCVRSSSRSQTRLGRPADEVRLIRPVMGQQGPDRACRLVGQRNSGHVVRPPRAQAHRPFERRLVPGEYSTGAVDQQGAEAGVSASMRTRPPVPLCRGAKPSQAANSRPDLKAEGYL